MTDRRNREFVLACLRELPKVYEALEGQVPRSSAGPPLGGGESPLPVRAAVLDLMAEFECSAPTLLRRALVQLGWHLPSVPLARQGQWLPCPEPPGCGMNSLRIDRQDWCVFCANPACKRRWRWGAEIERLGLILAEGGHDGEAVGARALEVAQEVANDYGTDAGDPEEVQSA
jgi:hypothetical protein